MVKHRAKKGCKSTAKVIGNHVTVKATCPLKPKKCTPKSPGKRKKTRTPGVCKGLKGRSLKECKKIIHKKYTNN